MASNTLSVDYTYDDGAAGGIAEYVRLTEVEYPNGRDVVTNYGTTGDANDRLSRIDSIGDGTNTHATYQYLGPTPPINTSAPARSSPRITPRPK